MPGVFDQATVYQVQQANDIADVINEHVSLRKKGSQMVGLCPFHDDHRPSLNVNVAKQIFKCFACGAGGDVFKFVQMRENLTFPQAIERLAERAGIKIKPAGPAMDKSKQTPDVDRNQLAKLNVWAAKYFQNNLYDEKKGKRARDYIAERKITPETAKKWQLGLAIDSPDDLLRQANAKNIPTRLLEHAGLIVGQAGSGFSDKFVNRLMFPITDVTGRVIGFGGRALSEQGAKYINSPATALFDKSNSLFGLQQARHQIVSTDTAIVVEGYTDCIMAHQVGCSNVVAALGTSFTTGQGRILRRYAKKVVLVFDSDIAGTEAANRALEVCLSQRIDIKLASVPQGKDPCDFLLTNGKEAFEQLVDSAVDVLRFKWDRLTEKFGTDDTFAGRKAAVDEFLQTIATSLWSGSLKSIDGGLLVNRLSKIIGLGSKEIYSELDKRVRRTQKNKSYDEQKQTVQDIDFGRGLSATAQREILEVLLNEPKLFKTVKQKIAPAVSLSNLADHFDVPILRQTADILFEVLSNNPAASLRDILAETESVEVSSCITQLEHTGREKGNFESRLNGAIDTLLRCHARRKIVQLKATEHPDKYLKSVTETAKKENRRNIGMT